MTSQRRIARADGLYRLLTRIPGSSFGAAPECAETDPEIFFPEPGGDSRKIAVAKEICFRCPVRSECLEQALAEGEPGFWGGTTENERRRIRRERRAAAAAGGESSGVAA